MNLTNPKDLADDILDDPDAFFEQPAAYWNEIQQSMNSRISKPGWGYLFAAIFIRGPDLTEMIPLQNHLQGHISFLNCIFNDVDGAPYRDIVSRSRDCYSLCEDYPDFIQYLTRLDPNNVQDVELLCNTFVQEQSTIFHHCDNPTIIGRIEDAFDTPNHPFNIFVKKIKENIVLRRAILRRHMKLPVRLYHLVRRAAVQGRE